MLEIKVATNERVIIVGKTGTGKTTLAKYITSPVRRLLVIDSKGSLGRWELEDFTDETLERFRGGDSVRIRVLKPPTYPRSFYDDVFRVAYEVGNCVVYVDEMFAVVPPGARAPEYINACYTRGREYGVGVWASTQRPSLIPLVSISEAEHFFAFRLMLQKDRQRMAEFMGSNVLERIPDRHGFYYMYAEEDEVFYVRSILTERR